MTRLLRGAAAPIVCAALLGVALAQVGCGFDIPPADAPPEPRVRAVLDPDSSTVPLPNTLAVDPDGTLPDLEVEDGDSAQQAFYDWLGELNGWLPQTPVEIPFDGELDEASLTAENVRLFRLEEGGELTELEIAELVYATVDDDSPARSRVTVVPADPLAPATSYGVVVTKGVQGENGVAIGEPAPIFFALHDRPIVTEGGEITIPQLEDDPATASDLEAVRASLEPITSRLGDLDLERGDVAMMFSWRTNRNVFTVLDPDTATIPLPNTLAMDEGEDGLPTFPAAALPALTQWRASLETDDPLPRTAQIYFDEYLDSLHGWPNDITSLPVEVPLSGPIDEESLGPDSVQLWRAGRGDEPPARLTDVTLEYVADEDAGSYKVVIQPGEELAGAGLALDTDYFAFITTDVTDPQGDPIKQPSALALALQPAPLVDDQGGSLVEQASDADAQTAAGVQQLLRPFVEAIEAQTDYDYDELASVWSFYTWRDPFIVFDPLNGDIPFPNAFLIGDDGTVDIPIPEGIDPLQRGIFEEVNTRDGFSVLGQGWVTVLGELDPASVTYYEDGQDDGELGAIAMAEVPGALPETLGPEYIELEYVPEYGKIMFRPKLPLRKGTLHAAILSDRLVGTNGLPAKPTPIFVMLASEFPLYDADSGESLIAQLPDSAAPDLEAGRMQYSRLFLSAQIVTGDKRDSITGAFAFTTDDVTEPLQQIHAQALARLAERAELVAERACEVDDTRDCAEDLLDNSDGSFDTYTGPYLNSAPLYEGGPTTDERDFSNIAQIQWAGEFDSVNFLDGDRAIKGWDALDTARVPITVYVPKATAECQPPFRVLIAQHGLGSSRLFSGLGLANTMASPEYCLATVAIDSVLHGGRTEGLDTLHPTTHPEDSGDGFLGIDFVVSTNNFTQSVVDLAVLNQIIRAGGLDSLVDNTAGDDGMGDPLPMFDISRVGIMGTSLGGIFSADLVTIDPELNDVVLTVAPGKLTYYLTEDSIIGENLLGPLESLGVLERGTFAFEQLISFVQWVADVVDPGAFARYTTDDTLDALVYDPMADAFSEGDGVPAADVLAQMALDDNVAPNVSTRQLAEVLGVSLEDSTYEARHGFIGTQNADDPNYAAAECARRQAAWFMRAALDDEDTTLPDELKAATCVANLD